MVDSEDDQATSVFSLEKTAFRSEIGEGSFAKELYSLLRTAPCDRNRNLIHDSLQVILYSHTHLCISFSITYSITGCAARKLTPKIEFSAYVNVRFLLD